MFGNAVAGFNFSSGQWDIYRDTGVNGCLDSVHSEYTLDLTVSNDIINGTYYNLSSNASFTGNLYSSTSTDGLVLDLLQSGHRSDGSNYNAVHDGIFLSNNEIKGTWYSIGGDGGDFLLVKKGTTPVTPIRQPCSSSSTDTNGSTAEGIAQCQAEPSSCNISTGDSNTDGSTAAGIAQCQANPSSCGITTSSGVVGTVDTNLNISMPSLNYTSLLGTQNIWANFEYLDINSDGKHTWALKDFGVNE